MAALPPIGGPSDPLGAPSLSVWAAAINATLNGSDVTVDARIGDAAKDTGRRNITAGATAGWAWPSGGLYLRRVGSQVTVAALSMQRAAAVAGTIVVYATAPTGFTPSGVGYFVRAMSFDAYTSDLPVTTSVVTAFAPRWLLAHDVKAAPTTAFWVLTYVTDDPWPITLPGTPA